MNAPLKWLSNDAFMTNLMLLVSEYGKLVFPSVKCLSNVKRVDPLIRCPEDCPKDHSSSLVLHVDADGRSLPQSGVFEFTPLRYQQGRQLLICIEATTDAGTCFYACDLSVAAVHGASCN